VTRRFYDVIVLGADLGPLLTAAILAKRGFRVLVLGCGTLDDTYEEDDLRLPRWPSYFAVGDTPIVKRVFSDLALWQILRRKLQPLEPSYQVVLPRARLDVTRDRERYAEECAREFGDAARSIEAFYGRLDGLNARLDEFLGEDLPLPPDGFFERRRFQRASLQNPFGPYGDGAAVWGDIPEDHPFRLAVLSQVRCATHGDAGRLTPLQVARLHGSWQAHGALPEGGLAGLRAFLRERILLHAGEIELGEAAAEIVMRRGRAVAVRRERDEEPTGAQYVVAGVETERLVTLFGDSPPRALTEAAQACRPRHRRFTCNLIVRREVVPVGMARHVCFVPEPPYLPIEDNLLFLEVAPLDDARAVISIQAFALAERVESDPGYLPELTRRIIDRAAWLVPSLERHLLGVSSPWMLPERAGAGGARIPPAERLERSPARMPGLPRLPDGSSLDLTCLSHRLAGRHLYLTGRDVIPGLGDEGVFLSAWAVARIITQKDPRRVRLRRELGSMIESG
jgi:phytoene dehydrogenase-like protein